MLALVSGLTAEVNAVAVAVRVLLALAVPALLNRRSAVRWVAVALIVLVVLETALGRSGIDFAVDTVYVAGAAIWFGVTLLSNEQWRTTNIRLGPLSLTLASLIVLAGAVQLALSGVGFDRRFYETTFGIALLVIIVLPIAVTVLSGFLLRGTEPGRAYRLGSAGIALGFLAWSALAAIPRHSRFRAFPCCPTLSRVRCCSARIGRAATWCTSRTALGCGDLVVHKDGGEVSIDVDAGDQPGPACADLGGQRRARQARP